MTTVLQYLVIAAVIGLLLFGLALVLFGRGERLSALPARTSPAQLPERGIDGADVRKVRFALALRGYRMSDVDWTLDRLADELDRTRGELNRVTGGAGGPSTDPEPIEDSEPVTAPEPITDPEPKTEPAADAVEPAPDAVNAEHAAQPRHLLDDPSADPDDDAATRVDRSASGRHDLHPTGIPSAHPPSSPTPFGSEA